MNKSLLDSELLAMVARLKAGQVTAAPIELEKFGPRMRSANVSRPEDIPATESSSVTLKLIVTPDSAKETEKHIFDLGGEVVSNGSTVVVANLGVDKLEMLEEIPGLQRAEASRRLQPRMEDARGPLTGADLGIADHGLSGKGVVVGVIDSGIDWAHDDFLNEDGTTRVELFIEAKRGQDANVSTYQEFDGVQINGAISDGVGVPVSDSNGHGTHCAGIAAGNGRASSGTHRGIASDATLMVMNCDLYDDEIIFGIRRIFEAAGNRPVVINLSLGGHRGAHDGTSAIENVIAEETGAGRIIVVAAGNEGNDNIHWNGELTQGEETVLVAHVGDPDFQFVDVWIPRGDNVDVILQTSSNESVPIDGLFHSTPIGRVGATNTVDSINGDQNITLYMANYNVGEAVTLRLTANSVIHGEVHAWSGPRARNVFQSAGNDFCVGMPATEEQAISVASFVSRTNYLPGLPTVPGLSVGALSPFSSRGPTRSGALKPDVAAPGQFITSALAADSELASDPFFAPRRDSSGKYVSIEGTSMATPFVAGCIALMLEREPKLNPAEIKQRLRATAHRDTATGRVWNREFGCGKINVQALLDY